MAYVEQLERYDPNLRQEMADEFNRCVFRARSNGSDTDAWDGVSAIFHETNQSRDLFHWEKIESGKALLESKKQNKVLEDKDVQSELKNNYLRCIIKRQCQEIQELKRTIETTKENSLAERLAQMELAITSVMGHLPDVRTAVDTGVAQQTLEVERQQKFRDDWYQHRRLTD
ncbi:hypothetical protein M408DRAFT_330508 [Serendipita vermifera MAFF 305830]|uniref:Uncharacterized protein n=1 Tax=Serendipita vermifera MAFF 305830 TaxID=933852 RepID=A0A0C2WJN6_SERVB|nr:hypothetical protein M408DRAFT_330508 [Serendipita vermifera MAFF 305830]